jgi:hypothetical protein
MILKGAALSMGVDLTGKGEIGLKDIETGKERYYYLCDRNGFTVDCDSALCEVGRD